MLCSCAYASYAATTPDPPTYLNFSLFDKAISINFLAPEWNGGTEVLEYTIVPANGTFSTVSQSPLFIGELENGLNYTLTLVARNAVGFSEASVEFWAVPGTSALGCVFSKSNIDAQFFRMIYHHDFFFPTRNCGLFEKNMQWFQKLETRLFMNESHNRFAPPKALELWHLIPETPKTLPYCNERSDSILFTNR